MKTFSEFLLAVTVAELLFTSAFVLGGLAMGLLCAAPRREEYPPDGGN